MIRNKIRYIIYLSSKIFKAKRKRLCSEDKILLVSHELSQTGAPILLLNMAKELHSKGYDIYVISLKYGVLINQFSKISKIRVIYSRLVFNITIRKLRKKGFIHAICNTTVVGGLTRNLYDADFETISLVHELPNIIKSLNIRNNPSILVKNSKIVYFPSNFVYSKFLEFTDYFENYKILPQGLYISKEHKPEKKHAKKLLQDKYCIDFKNLVLSVATGDERKGFDIFLDLAIKNRFQDTYYCWVGNIDNKILKRELKKANITKIKNFVQFKFITNFNDLIVFYDAADIYLMTSREEPFGSVVLEAFNSETPVIGFDNAGGFIDVVKSGETGLLAEYCNVEDMISKIEYLLSNKTIRTEMGKKAKMLVGNFKFIDYVSDIVSNFSKE
jgi:glycosyltransferase involved in cell wall biosynthesis